MEKRGLGHIEIILAFVLFIGFLSFALYFFNPLNPDRLLSNSLVYTNDEISDNVSVLIESFSVVIEETVIEDNIGIQLNPANSNAQVRVEDELGLKMSSRYENGIVYFNRPGSNFVNIFFSEDLVNGELGEGILLDSGQYNVSSSDEKRIFSEKRLLYLNQSYYNDYNDLIENFNLPRRIDFGFTITFLNGLQISGVKDVPDNAQVEANTESIEVLRLEGDIEFAEFTTLVW